MALLEKAGYNRGQLLLIDGAPSLLQQQFVAMHLPIDSEKQMEIALLFKLFSHIYPNETLIRFKVRCKLKAIKQIKTDFVAGCLRNLRYVRR